MLGDAGLGSVSLNVFCQGLVKRDKERMRVVRNGLALIRRGLESSKMKIFVLL